MASAAQQAAAELRRVQAYLESQGTLLGGEALQQQAAVWQGKLSSTQIGPDEALLLVETIKAGPWTEDQQRGLAMSVNSAVLQSTSPANHRRALQEISDFSRYLSSNDQKVLADPAISGARKMEQVACRLRRLGIHTASEVALRHIFSIALKAGLQCNQDPDSLKMSFNELKRIVKQTCKGAPRMREHLTKYPHSPSELPKWLFDEAYDTEDMPEALNVSQAEVAGQAALISCRSNNKLLTKNKPGTQMVQCAPQPQQGVPQMGMGMPDQSGACFQMMNMWSNMWMNMMGANQHPQQQQPQQQSPVPLQFMKPINRGQKALGNGDEVTENGGQLQSSASALVPQSSPSALVPVLPVGSEAKDPVTPPQQSALQLPPAAQVELVAEATQARKDAKTEQAKVDEKATVPVKAKAKAKSKAKAKEKAKAEAKAVVKAKAKAAGKAKAKSQAEPAKAVVEHQEDAEPAAGAACFGKSSYGVAKDLFKAKFKGAKQDFEASWRASDACQVALSKMSWSELKKRRLDHLWVEDKD